MSVIQPRKSLVETWGVKFAALIIFFSCAIRLWSLYTSFGFAFYDSPDGLEQYLFIEYSGLSAGIFFSVVLFFLSLPSFLNVVTTCVTVLIFIFVFELILTSGMLDCQDCVAPVWIPEKFKVEDRVINQKLTDYARSNRHGFTDVNHEYEKKEGVYRVAILGDSFVWGDGLPLGQGWAHQLKKMIEDQYPQVEVLLWGKQGWSTKNELEFLKEEGWRYHPDFLILGFVDNDPDMGDIKQRNLVWDKAKILDGFHSYFPHVFDFLIAHINSIIQNRIEPSFNYNYWVEQLYEEDNLKKYEIVWREFAELLRQKNVPALIVTTPNYPVTVFQERYEKVIPMWDRIGLTYINLYPEFAKKFTGIPLREMYANPANGHPNAMSSAFYAERVFEWLRSQGVLMGL